MRPRTMLRDVRPTRPDAAGFTSLVVLKLLAGTAGAASLDFSAALQAKPAGSPVGTLTLPNGATMHVTAHNAGGGPDLAIIFDSAHPTGGDFDLGTPNEDFGGPGKGSGGGDGKPGENATALGHVIIIAENDVDANHDGLVDVPDDESGGGIVWLSFSHAGRVALTFVDVDEDESGPRLVLFHSGTKVGEAHGHSVGQNGAERVDLSSYGDIDTVEIHMDGSNSIGAITVDVPVVGVEPGTWSKVKSLFR
jgi:hypothetical protein